MTVRTAAPVLLRLLRGTLSGLALCALPVGLAAQVQFPVPRDLVARDHGASSLAGARGLDSSLATILADDAVLLWPGAPVARGRAAALALLAAQPARYRRVMWDAVFTELSNDGALAVSYGTTITLPPGPDSAAHPGRFIAAWRRTPGGRWDMVGLCLAGWPSGDTYVPPPAAVAPPPLAPLPRENPYARADYAFSDRSGRDGVGAAFEAFAASDAVAAGARVQPYIRGPANIRRAFEGAGDTRASWTWWPVVAAGDSAGAIGFTVGEAVIRGSDENGRPETDYSKYMTLWRREAGGAVKFLADGGSTRPAPATGR